jgi:hypothetical protein
MIEEDANKGTNFFRDIPKNIDTDSDDFKQNLLYKQSIPLESPTPHVIHNILEKNEKNKEDNKRLGQDIHKHHNEIDEAE